MADIQREKRALDIAEEALELETRERPSFLEKACAGDREMLGRVERLILVDEERGELDTPVAFPVVRDFVSEPVPEQELPPGTHVGSYELLRLIARGGMGRVYEARQDRPRRRVALKMMRIGLDSDSVRRRFEYESEVLAHLRHPGIAQVYEAGVYRFETPLGTRELPYFALEFVPDARTLTEWVHDEAPPLEEIIRCFVSICEAVHHGHMKGVVHRDLKPANILIDGSGTPKVIDYGVARAISGELDSSAVETHTGQLIGTIHYMSPEQLAQGPTEVDARSDVYALGVVLFELICGRLPFDVDGKSIHAIGRAIVDDLPIRPRRLAPALPVDIEAIILCVLDKDPRRRYDSAAALAADLKRFLASEPVEARPATTFYHLKLFARRNRSLVVASGVSLAVLIGAGWYIGRAGMQVEAAEAARSVAMQNERRAEEEGEALGDELFELSTGLVFDALEDLGRLQGGAEAKLELVRGVVDKLDRLATVRSDDPKVRFALARGFLSLGDVLGYPRTFNLGDQEGARLNYAKAQSTAELLLSADPSNVEVKRFLIDVFERESSLMMFHGRYEAAEVATAHRVELLRDVLADDKGAPENYRSLADALEGHGMTLAFMERKDEAYEAFRDALEAWSELVDADPGNFSYRFQLAQITGKLSTVQRLRGDLEDSLVLLEETLYRNEELLDERPSDIFVRSARAGNLGLMTMLLRDLGRLEESADFAAQAVADAETLRRGDPASKRFQRDLGLACYEQGSTLTLLAAESSGEVSANAAFLRCVELLAPLEAEGNLEVAIADVLEKARRRLGDFD